jgi:hypothetical protein
LNQNLGRHNFQRTQFFRPNLDRSRPAILAQAI